jgi:hypothetical protein
MERKKITVRGVDIDAIELLHQIKQEERRTLGAIVGDAIRDYWENTMEEVIEGDN